MDIKTVKELTKMEGYKTSIKLQGQDIDVGIGISGVVFIGKTNSGRHIHLFVNSDDINKIAEQLKVNNIL